MVTSPARISLHQRATRGRAPDATDWTEDDHALVSDVPQSRSALSARLLERAARESDPVERKRLQDEVVVLHMGLARAIAARYRGRGIAHDDLCQAASMALLKAARRFDVSRGVEFLSYAVVTMKGEVKRQFRDYGWMVRPPRTIQKLQADVSRADGELTHELGRSPKVGEVADRLGVAEDDVLEALSADGCFTPTSLDTPVGADGTGVLGELIPGDDPAMSDAEARVMLAPAVRALPERERDVLYLRFFGQQTQAQIAEEIGVTQMQVSRILARVLTQLRGELG
jgi:RNA polymerase sigma-B factor